MCDEEDVEAPDLVQPRDDSLGLDFLLHLDNPDLTETLDLRKGTPGLEQQSERPVRLPEISVSGEQRASEEDWAAFPEVLGNAVCRGQPETDDSPDVPSLPPLGGSSVRVEIPECALLTPRSCYEPFEPGVPAMAETQALATLAAVARRLQKSAGGFTEYDLDEFAVYCDTHTYPCEMRPLHHLDTRMQLGVFFFDGVLSVRGQSSIFVKRVPISAMPIDNYGDVSKHTVRGHVWLQSALNSHRGIYYRLGKPAREYSRFYQPSL